MINANTMMPLTLPAVLGEQVRTMDIIKQPKAPPMAIRAPIIIPAGFFVAINNAPIMLGMNMSVQTHAIKPSGVFGFWGRIGD